MKGWSVYFNILACIAVSVLMFASSVSATIIGGASIVPGYGNDDGSTQFSPENILISGELLDLVGASGFTTYFGFYFTGADLSNPSNLIPLFEPTDQDTTGTGGNPQIAYADFSTGLVTDVDAGSPQNFFTTQPGNIGFFLSIDSAIYFTDPSMNPLGADFFAAFPSLTSSSEYILGFENIAKGQTLALEYVSGINPVPEPSTFLLFGSGLMSFIAVIRRKKKR